MPPSYTPPPPRVHPNRRARLIRTHRNFSRLGRATDKKLGIPRLLPLRRGRCAVLEEARVQATKRELLLFLKTPDLPPKLDKLRRTAIERLWLC